MSTEENRPPAGISPPRPASQGQDTRQAGMARGACYGIGHGLQTRFRPRMRPRPDPRARRLHQHVGPLSLAGDSGGRADSRQRPAGRPSPPHPVQPSAELAQRLAQLRGEATRSHQAFLSAAPRTRALVNAARGSAVASDPWIAAQASLSGLEVTRNRTMEAMADLDKLLLQAEMEGGAREAVAETQAQVNSLLDEENALVRQLAGSLRQ